MLCPVVVSMSARSARSHHEPQRHLQLGVSTQPESARLDQHWLAEQRETQSQHECGRSSRSIYDFLVNAQLTDFTQAFERVTASTLHGAKKGSLWRLTDRALQEGVISTTRYRKDPKRKPERRSSPALKRQISGAKGGQATRAASAHRRAMQARTSGAQHYGGIERHHRGMRKQEAAYFPPTSMPTSSHPATSPQQPMWMPNSMAPPPIPHHVLQPPSPYFLQPMEDDAFSTITHPSLSNPHTPNEVQVGYDGPSKAMTNSPAAFGSPPRGGFLTEFELSHLDHETRGLFGNHDEFMPDTPSLATEGSFISEDMTPVTMDRLSVEPMRS